MIMATAAICSSAFLAGFRPASRITVAEWADTYRIVGKPSPEPGPWRTDRVPYTREIMEDLSPSSPVEISVLMKAAQGAGTEILLNALGCWVHRYPDSAMVIQPTVATAKKFVRIRLDRFIEANPVLRELVIPARSRNGSNTMSLKELVTGDTVVICGANSGADLRSYPSKYACLDEVDGYPPDLDGEGDPTELVIQRTAAYRGRKIFMLSTPTLEEVSLIWRWFQRGDQRKYFVPCPFCQHMQPLIWHAEEGKLGGLVWPQGKPEEARYQCEHCGDRFEEWRKVDLLQRGEWRPQAPGVGGGKIRSRQINALYYPYGWPESAWTNLAAKWETDHRDPLKLKTFVNLKLGEPWKDPSEAKADADTLLARAESFGPEIPEAAAVLTVGCDVQGNRIEAELVAWGKDEESWSIEHMVFLGDTAKPIGQDRQHPSPWEQLDRWLAGEWLSERDIPLRISAGCVDAGYQKQVVTQWCGERFSRRVWATLGRPGSRAIWPRRPGKPKGVKSPEFVIGVDSAKENIYARLRLATPGPGFLHFPKGRDRDYFEQLTSEIRVPDYTGPIPKFVWRKKLAGARNEALDCRVYAYAALCGLLAGGLRLNAEVDAFHAMTAPGAPAAATQQAQPRRAPRPVVGHFRF
jgi:phage terminase large subunit GpA-like protein